MAYIDAGGGGLYDPEKERRKKQAVNTLTGPSPSPRPGPSQPPPTGLPTFTGSRGMYEQAYPTRGGLPAPQPGHAPAPVPPDKRNSFPVMSGIGDFLSELTGNVSGIGNISLGKPGGSPTFGDVGKALTTPGGIAPFAGAANPTAAPTGSEAPKSFAPSPEQEEMIWREIQRTRELNEARNKATAPTAPVAAAPAPVAAAPGEGGQEDQRAREEEQRRANEEQIRRETEEARRRNEELQRGRGGEEEKLPGEEEKLPGEEERGWVEPIIEKPPLNLGQPGAGDGAGGQSAQVQQLTASLMNDLNSLRNEALNSKTPDVAQVYLSFTNSIMALLDREEEKLRKRSEEQGQANDPQTEFAISQIRKRLGDDIKETQESLNARGLYHSGILAELEQKLRTGATTEEARLMAERLKGIQDQFNAGMDRISGQRFQTASSFGLAGAGAQIDAEFENRRRKDALFNTLIGTQTDLRGQLQQGEQFEAGMAFDREKFEEDKRQFGEEYALEQQRQATQQNQWLEEFGAEKAKHQETIGNQRLLQEREAAAAMERLRAELSGGKYQGSTGTTGNVNAATQDIINQVLQAPSGQAALDAFNAQKNDMAATGVDIARVRAEIFRKFGI